MLFITIPLLGDFLHELSNDGARAQFEEYLEPYIIPAMVHCARVRLTHYIFIDYHYF